MWYARLKRFAPKPKLAVGLGTAATVLAAAWFIGALGASGPVHALHSTVVGSNRDAISKPAVSPPNGDAAVQIPPAALPPLTADQSVIMPAKFDVSNPSPLLNTDQPPPVQAPPAAPEVASVDAPVAAAPPPPQPMEVAMQTAEAPAAVAAGPAQPAKVSYFARGAPSAQHLPIPSH